MAIKQKKLLFLFLMTFLIAGCTNLPEEPRSKQALVNDVMKKVAKRLKHEKKLYPCGEGAQMMDEIQMLALSFNYYKEIDIEEARELLISSVSDFVHTVNKNKEIQPYLGNRPFEAKNIEIRIFIRNLDGSEISAGKLTVVSSIDGILSYKISQPEYPTLKSIHKETYEEALQQIEQASQKSA